MLPPLCHGASWERVYGSVKVQASDHLHKHRNRRLLDLLTDRPTDQVKLRRANPDVTRDPDREPWRGGAQRKGSSGETTDLLTPFEVLPGK